MEINDKPVKMQIDCGASYNVIPKQFVPEGNKINKANRTPRACNKDSIAVIGASAKHMVNSMNKKKYRGGIVVGGTPL